MTFCFFATYFIYYLFFVVYFSKKYFINLIKDIKQNQNNIYKQIKKSLLFIVLPSFTFEYILSEVIDINPESKDVDVIAWLYDLNNIFYFLFVACGLFYFFKTIFH